MRAPVVYLTLAVLIVLSSASLGAMNKTVDAADDNTPSTGLLSYEFLVSTVMAHADDMLPEDELIEVDGIWVKNSNYHGVVVGDRTYYYCLAPHQCSCPVCRGSLDLEAANVLYRDKSTDFPMSIYELHYNEPAPSINWCPYTLCERHSVDLP